MISTPETSPAALDPATTELILNRRLHGSLGMISPVKYEEAHYAARQAVGSTTLEAAELP